MRSQDVRKLAPEMDPLRMGMGWTEEDLEKPQILVESTFGDSHPGSAHLFELVNLAAQGVQEAGGKAARYFATDICDGMAQGHDGINYSLASRDAICNLIEIHERATTFDAGVFIASCDKAVPAHLMAIGRTNLPTVMVTGGVMDAGPGLLTLEQIGMYSAMCARGEISEEKFKWYKHLSFLRGVLVYGHGFHHADHGGIAGTDVARHGAAARHVRGSAHGGGASGQASHVPGRKESAPPRHGDDGKL